MATEDLYKYINRCGPFQCIHVILVQFPRFAAAWTLLLMVFGIYNPGWTCIRPKNSQIGNGSFGDGFHRRSGHADDRSMSSFNVGVGVNASKLTSVVGEQHRAIAYRFASTSPTNSNMSERNLYVNDTKRSVNGSVCEVYDYCDVIEFDPSSRTIVSQFSLVCDKSFIPSIIISIQGVGTLIGVNIWGQLGETCGRKYSLYGSAALTSISCFLAIFSTSWQMYTVFLFFIGLGMSGCFVLTGVYSMEFLDTKWRGILGGIPVWNVSLGIFAIIIFFLRNWVHIHIAASCLSALACIGVFWTPESIKWLLLHRKEENVKNVVRKIVRINKRDEEVSSYFLEELSTTDFFQQKDERHTFLDLFRTSRMALITVRVAVLWFITFLNYYFLTYSVKALGGDFYTNILISGFSEIPFVLLVSPFINRIGRRLTIAFFMSLSTLGCVTVIVAHFLLNEHIREPVITYSAFFAKASTIASIASLSVLSLELFPTAVRSLGMAFADTVGRIGTILSPLLIPRDQNSLVFAYIVLSVASLINFVLIWTLTETKNQTLKDGLENGRDVENDLPLKAIDDNSTKA